MQNRFVEDYDPTIEGMRSAEKIVKSQAVARDGGWARRDQ